jgi:hypothetical protein
MRILLDNPTAQQMQCVPKWILLEALKVGDADANVQTKVQSGKRYAASQRKDQLEAQQAEWFAQQWLNAFNQRT